MSIQSIIDIYRMQEITKETKIKIMISLGKAVNHELGMNLTYG